MVSTFSMNLIFYCLSIQSIICFITSESIGFTLPLVPHFSPESPFYPGNLTFEEKVDKAMELSMLRAHYIDFMSSQGSISSNNIRLTMHPVGIRYTTEIHLGTPKSTQFLLFDTGSALLWPQCKPCENCFNQSSIPIFVPNQSTTYSRVPCDDPVCRDYKCINGKCMYKVSYADGTMTEGLVSRETFTFESNKGHPTSVPNIVFGCGNDNKGFGFDRTQISGIIGFKNGGNSLISQLFRIIQGRFSYCLVYSKHEVTGKSSLRFGEDAVIKTRHVIQTTTIVNNVGNYYYVNLIDVSVGNKRIRFPPGTFELKSDGKGGCLFDTGTAAIHFPQGPYDVVMKVLDKHFMSHDLERVYNISTGLDYCYKYNPRFQDYLSMTLHFQNADYVVLPPYQYERFNAEQCFCVAVVVFPGQSQKTIIGAWQQQNMRLLYDLNKRVIKFVRETCAADH